MFACPGIVQVYYGNELGLLGGGDPDNRRDMPAWALDPGTRAEGDAKAWGDDPQNERRGWISDAQRKHSAR